MARFPILHTGGPVPLNAQLASVATFTPRKEAVATRLSSLRCGGSSSWLEIESSPGLALGFHLVLVLAIALSLFGCVDDSTCRQGKS